ncbi:MAG: septum formation initiator family protein [Muribaculaceae bacterium]|nr:septum formation initiator family protein [Muribaculaceae bacterium]MDE6449467.1 septum formation initiator family protein [Muribaculaceae bacterium]
MKAKGLYNWFKRYITVPLAGVVCFVVYVCFFNEENSVIDRIRYQKRIEELQSEIADNRDSLEYYRTLNANLETDRENIERVVRERYRMQRPNEDIYVFE